jgi:hypothetical protein
MSERGYIQGNLEKTPIRWLVWKSRLTFIRWLEAGFLPAIKASTEFNLRDGTAAKVSNTARTNDSRSDSGTGFLCGRCAQRGCANSSSS